MEKVTDFFSPEDWAIFDNYVIPEQKDWLAARPLNKQVRIVRDLLERIKQARSGERQFLREQIREIRRIRALLDQQDKDNHV